ncbi:MAG: RNA polymerase factor sigma-54 [Candidatus Competibacteraceae bacterium]|nr:RNA polymerase factor sigma-54 [Candidatus Competibacteraceae bacterium]
MLKQSLQQKLLQKLSPQQIQLMKLLQVPTAALEQRIKEELEANPALEEGEDQPEEQDEEQQGFEDDYEEISSEALEREKKSEDIDINEYLNDDDYPYYKTQVNNMASDDDSKEIPFSAGISFQEHLISQIGLRNLSDHQQALARHIIGNIDDDGYLMRDLTSMVDDLAFSMNIETTVEELEKILTVIQDFDPPGIGARNLQECLIIQLRKKENPSSYTQLAIQVLSRFFDEFTKKHYDKIQRRLSMDDAEMKKTIQEILHLNPKPGNSMAQTSRSAQAILPDFILHNNDGKLELFLNAKNAPELKVSRTYAEMLEGFSKNKKNADRSQKDAILFVKQKLDAARWFIDAIKQRQETLMAVMGSILSFQYDYFSTGDEVRLKPMILKDIADAVGLDISTVSRVANSKYIETAFGTFLLKSFFSESLSTDSGEEVSTREVKKILQDCIGNENKRRPLTDEKLADILKEKGYNIARRTVAKYREQLDIPVARLRKELK